MALIPKHLIFRFSSFFLAAVLAAQIVPDQFIIEMAEAPAAKGGVSRAALVEKQSLRRSLEGRGVTTLASYETLLNGLAIEAPGATIESLESMPGVRKVYPVYMVYPSLDTATMITRVRDAWHSVGGMDKAGAGIKIAIIDTGVDQDHPGLSDASLVVPAGYPKGGSDSDLTGVSNKVIVARSYATQTPADRVGHGTGVAMAAAGRLVTAPFAEVSGVAPKAFIGNYKVFTDNGGGATTANIVRAMEDAVNDGMDVLNLSLGVAPAGLPDVTVQAAARAVERGVVVVTAAGNDGPGLGTLSTLSAGSQSVIAVGASANGRQFGGGVAVNGESYRAVPGSVVPATPVTGPLGDAGLACAALPEGSLTGRVALILRGECFFSEKLDFAQRAGAAGAIIYTDDRPVDPWTQGTNRLPGVMVSNQDGQRLKAIVADQPGVSAEIRFSGLSFPLNSGVITGFSSRGPSFADLIKPDLVAPGNNFYTATQVVAPQGELFNASGFRITSGTSFASPLVAGAVAVVKSARPNLTVDHLRSLVINTAEPFPDPAGLRDAGAGMLNVDRAVRSMIAAAPVSVHFGSGQGPVDVTRAIRITNLAAAPDTLQVIAEPAAGSPAPQFSDSSFHVPPNGTVSVMLRWSVAGLAPGEYRGVMTVQGNASDVAIRIPYAYLVRDSVPRFLTVITPELNGTPRARSAVNLWIRVGSASGAAISDVQPKVEVIDGGGDVNGILSFDRTIPGFWRAQVRTGPAPGLNSFKVSAGDIEEAVQLTTN